MEEKAVHPELDAALESIDEAKRETVRRIVLGAAFAIPVVASFAIDGLTVNPAFAAVSNQSSS
jgi:hypothetical protein